MKTAGKISALAIAGAAALIVAGCGEKPQDVPMKSGKYQGKPDTRPWEGEKLVFEANDFKRGDKASWEAALRTRNNAQNEYVRIK